MLVELPLLLAQLVQRLGHAGGPEPVGAKVGYIDLAARQVEFIPGEAVERRAFEVLRAVSVMIVVAVVMVRLVGVVWVVVRVMLVMMNLRVRDWSPR